MIKYGHDSIYSFNQQIFTECLQKVSSAMLGANNHKQNRYGFTVLIISQKMAG